MTSMANTIEPDSDELLTVADIARILKRAEYTVRQMFKRGAFPSATTFQGHKYIRRADFYKDLGLPMPTENQQK